MNATHVGMVTRIASKNSLLAASIMASAAVWFGTTVLADTASDIEQFYLPGSYIQYDNLSGDYPVVTAIASQPGTTAGHLYTSWAVLAQDATGSLDLFITQSALTNLPGYAGYNSIAVGDKINIAGQWSPYHQIPEIAFSTVVASNNYFSKISSGNALPTPPSFTTSQLNVNNQSNHIEFAGTFIEIQNATISGSTGSFQSTFPDFSQANIASESYTITDNTGSMTMFDWVTSNSGAGALAGSQVPTAAYLASIGSNVNIFGFVSYNTGGPAEFTMLSEQFVVPEPSTIALVGMGLVGLFVARRNRRR